MNKITVMAVLLIVTTGVLGFGSGNPQSQASTGAGGPVKLTVAVAENLRIEDYKTNTLTQKIEKASNTDLEFVLYPSTDYVTKLNLMVMAGGGDLQDIIIASPGDARVYQWANEGAIIPLTKYYTDPRLSENIQNAIKKAGDFTKEIISPDGELYSIPSVYQEPGNEFPVKYWYNKVWAEKLGVKAPTTTEEMRAFLRTLVTSDPNGNGRADEIGIIGNFLALPIGGYNAWFHYLMTPFTYVGSSMINVDNGVISVPYNSEAWRAGLKYIRSLFIEGLLPLDNLTQDQKQVVTLLNADPIRVASFSWNSTSAISSAAIAEHFYLGEPLKNMNGVQITTMRPSSVNPWFMISTNCKNPEAAFKVGDVMMREDLSLSNRYGEQGLDWDYVKDVANVESKFVPSMEGWAPSFLAYDGAGYWGGNAVQNSGWRQSGPLCIPYAAFNGRWNPIANQTPWQLTNSNTGKIYIKEKVGPKEALGKLIYSEDEIAVISDIQTTLNNYVLEMTSNFFAGNRDIDASWNAYLAELNAIGLQRFLSTNQKVYDRMYKK